MVQITIISMVPLEKLCNTIAGSKK